MTDIVSFRDRRCANMKNSDGQLYTIEGFAAALIMIMTAYLVVNATSVYTAGDTHISDMQLESLGTDALMVMDTNESQFSMSPLRSIIQEMPTGETNNATFRSLFFNLTNNMSAARKDHIQYTASYTCRVDPGTNTTSYPLSQSRNLTGGEHAVRATKWVMVNKGPVLFCGTTNEDRAVLVEVLMWRD